MPFFSVNRIFKFFSSLVWAVSNCTEFIARFDDTFFRAGPLGMPSITTLCPVCGPVGGQAGGWTEKFKVQSSKIPRILVQ